MQLFVNEKRLIEVRKSTAERIAKCQREGLCTACLGKVEKGERTVRGMHIKCYFATRRAIKLGKTTEEQRVREGKMLEAQSGGRKASNPVTCELDG